MQLITISTSGKESTMTASPLLFSEEINERSLAQALRVYLANKRQATSKTKTRGEVSRTKKKMYKQKGTGGARHAARSAPIFVGGGVAHGPKGLENWSLKLSKKQRRQALSASLSLQADTIRVVEGFETTPESTNKAALLVKQSGALLGKNILVITPELDALCVRVLKNIPEVRCQTAVAVTAREILEADFILVTQAALNALELRVGGDTTVVAPAEMKLVEKPTAKAAAKKKVSTKKKNK